MPKKLFEVKMRAECERVMNIRASNEEEAIEKITLTSGFDNQECDNYDYDVRSI